jgi:hypothetical protein
MRSGFERLIRTRPEGPAVNRPGRQAGIRRLKNGAPKARHSARNKSRFTLDSGPWANDNGNLRSAAPLALISAPFLSRPDGRAYPLAALRASWTREQLKDLPTAADRITAVKPIPHHSGDCGDSEWPLTPTLAGPQSMHNVETPGSGLQPGHAANRPNASAPPHTVNRTTLRISPHPNK